MFNILLFIFTLLIYFMYYISTRKFSYWKKKNVPYLQPVPLFGNYKDYILLNTFIGNATQKMCEQLPGEPYIGVYYGTEPTLLVQDPELLKLIMVKDFYYFSGREVSKYSDHEAITQAMFFNYGDRWKVIRQNLTPLFSTAKMRNMFSLIEKCTRNLEDMLEYEASVSNCIETNRLISRFMMDCVGSCVFGIEINLMHRNFENNPFANVGDFLFGRSNMKGYKNVIRSIWPKLFYALGLQSFPREAREFMCNVVTNVFKLRNYKSIGRNDFIDLLLCLKGRDYLVGDSIFSMKTGESKKATVKFDNETIAAQCAGIFGGGFETSATTLTLTLFELAKNQETLFKVQKEIDKYLSTHDNKLDYDSITKLPYLSACVDETLRLYPVFNIVTREVMEKYTLPNGLTLDKGIRIHIPIYHIHRDQRNFCDPEQYRPERFLPEEKHKIKPFTYLPFGEGPRTCIGMRFAKMEVHAGLITVLKNYNVYLADGMSSTIDFDPRMIVSHTIGDVNLRFERQKQKETILPTDKYIM